MKIMHDDKKIDAIQDQGAENSSDISGLKEAVGDEDGGLIKAVADLQTEKATLSDVETLLASGDVDEIKADSILEINTGYACTPHTSIAGKGSVSTLYAGAVKTGNKLTLVYAFTFTPSAGQSGNAATATFGLPEAVGHKIIPYEGTRVDTRQIAAASDIYSYKEIGSYLVKSSDIFVYFGISNIEQLTAGTTYYIRQEITLLLGDSLISNE